VGAATGSFTVTLPLSEPTDVFSILLLARSTHIGTAVVHVPDVARHPRILRGFTERIEFALEPWAAAAVADKAEAAVTRLSVEVSMSLAQPAALLLGLGLARPSSVRIKRNESSPVAVPPLAAAPAAAAHKLPSDLIPGEALPLKLNTNLIRKCVVLPPAHVRRKAHPANPRYEQSCQEAPSAYRVRLVDLVYTWALQSSDSHMHEDRKVSLQNKLGTRRSRRC
jgi:hypothetical protein